MAAAASLVGRLILGSIDATVVSPGLGSCESNCGNGSRYYWLRFYILLTMK